MSGKGIIYPSKLDHVVDFVLQHERGTAPPETGDQQLTHQTLAISSPDTEQHQPATERDQSETGGQQSTHQTPVTTSPGKERRQPEAGGQQSTHQTPMTTSPDTERHQPQAGGQQSTHQTPMTSSPDTERHQPEAGGQQSTRQTPMTTSPDTERHQPQAGQQSTRQTPMTTSPDTERHQPQAGGQQSTHQTPMTTSPDTERHQPQAGGQQSTHQTPMTTSPDTERHQPEVGGQQSTHQTPVTTSPDTERHQPEAGGQQSTHQTPVTTSPGKERHQPQAGGQQSTHQTPMTTSPDTERHQPDAGVQQSTHQTPMTTSPDTERRQPEAGGQQSTHQTPVTTSPGKERHQPEAGGQQSTHQTPVTTSPGKERHQPEAGGQQSTHQTPVTTSPDTERHQPDAGGQQSTHQTPMTTSPDTERRQPEAGGQQSTHQTPMTSSPDTERHQPEAGGQQSTHQTPVTTSPGKERHQPEVGGQQSTHQTPMMSSPGIEKQHHPQVGGQQSTDQTPVTSSPDTAHEVEGQQSTHQTTLTPSPSTTPCQPETVGQQSTRQTPATSSLGAGDFREWRGHSDEESLSDNSSSKSTNSSESDFCVLNNNDEWQDLDEVSSSGEIQEQSQGTQRLLLTLSKITPPKKLPGHAKRTTCKEKALESNCSTSHAAKVVISPSKLNSINLNSNISNSWVTVDSERFACYGRGCPVTPLSRDSQRSSYSEHTTADPDRSSLSEKMEGSNFRKQDQTDQGRSMETKPAGSAVEEDTLREHAEGGNETARHASTEEEPLTMDQGVGQASDTSSTHVATPTTLKVKRGTSESNVARSDYTEGRSQLPTTEKLSEVLMEDRESSTSATLGSTSAFPAISDQDSEGSERNVMRSCCTDNRSQTPTAEKLPATTTEDQGSSTPPASRPPTSSFTSSTTDQSAVIGVKKEERRRRSQRQSAGACDSNSVHDKNPTGRENEVGHIPGSQEMRPGLGQTTQGVYTHNLQISRQKISNCEGTGPENNARKILPDEYPENISDDEEFGTGGQPAWSEEKIKEEAILKAQVAIKPAAWNALEQRKNLYKSLPPNIVKKRTKLYTGATVMNVSGTWRDIDVVTGLLGEALRAQTMEKQIQTAIADSQIALKGPVDSGMFKVNQRLGNARDEQGTMGTIGLRPSHPSHAEPGHSGQEYRVGQEVRTTGTSVPGHDHASNKQPWPEEQNHDVDQELRVAESHGLRHIPHSNNKAPNSERMQQQENKTYTGNDKYAVHGDREASQLSYPPQEKIVSENFIQTNVDSTNQVERPESQGDRTLENTNHQPFETSKMGPEERCQEEAMDTDDDLTTSANVYGAEDENSWNSRGHGTSGTHSYSRTDELRSSMKKDIDVTAKEENQVGLRSYADVATGGKIPTNQTSQQPRRDRRRNRTFNNLELSESTKKVFCTKEGLTLMLYAGDITALSDVDCIVNSTDPELQHKGGAAAAIKKAAGPGFMKLCENQNLEATKCISSGAGNLPYKRVLHVFMERWESWNDGDCIKKLKKTIWSLLNTTNKENMNSVALSGIGTGGLNFPIEKWVKCVVGVIKDYSKEFKDKHLKEIHFVDKNSEFLRCLEKGLLEAFPQIWSQPNSRDITNSKQPSASVESNQPATFPISGACQVVVKRTDITTFQGDAIVIAVDKINSTLLSKAVSRAAGTKYKVEKGKKLRTKAEGVFVTEAGQLPCKYVVHVVRSGSSVGEEGIGALVSCILSEASALKINKIAFPAIFTGFSGISGHMGCQVLVDNICSYIKDNPATSLRMIYLVDTDEEKLDQFRVLLTKQISVQEMRQNESTRHEPPSLPLPENEFKEHSNMPSKQELEKSQLPAMFAVSDSCTVWVDKADFVKFEGDALAVTVPKNYTSADGQDLALTLIAGESYYKELKEVFAKPGDVVVTGGGKMGYNHVIHGVLSTMYSSGIEELRKLVPRILNKADELDVKVLVLPPLWTGLSDITVDDGCSTVIQGICRFVKMIPDTSVRKIYLLNTDIHTLECYCMELRKQKPNSECVDPMETRHEDLDKSRVPRETCVVCRQDCVSAKVRGCGHILCGSCLVPGLDVQRCCKEAGKPSSQTDPGIGAGKDVEECVICLCSITDPKRLPCGHRFCKGCIDEYFRKCTMLCPVCKAVCGKVTGNQPDGTMEVDETHKSCAGYYGHNTIIIHYNFPDGRQQEGHPHPGKRYRGAHRTAYLPKTKEGRRILRLLRQAFNQRLLFTIGRSVTTGRDDVVTWNDVHHKTSMDGGPEKFGYPDPTYLARVREELKAKGITESGRDGTPV